MNPVDVLIIAIVVAILGAAVWFVYKSGKSGKKCIGCPDGTCSSCSGCSCGCGTEKK